VFLPLGPRLEADVVAALDQRLAERDRRERVPRVSESG
jgi:hypothetical protein